MTSILNPTLCLNVSLSKNCNIKHWQHLSASFPSFPSHGHLLALLADPTVKGLVLAGEGGLQGASVVFQKPLQLPAAQRGQVVLHVACAAGVTLGTDAKVLPCQQDGGRGDGGGGDEMAKGEVDNSETEGRQEEKNRRKTWR